MGLESLGTDEWSAETLYEVLVCPVCGLNEFVGMMGMFAYCDGCNARTIVSQTVNGDGYLVTVDSTTVFPEFVAPIPGGSVHGKFVGVKSPELIWWAQPTVDGERVNDWSPAEPRDQRAAVQSS